MSEVLDPTIQRILDFGIAGIALYFMYKISDKAMERVRANSQQ